MTDKKPTDEQLRERSALLRSQYTGSFETLHYLFDADVIDELISSRAELCELIAEKRARGQQQPVAYLNDAHLGRGHIEGEVGEEGDAPGMIAVYREPLGCLYIPDTQALELLQKLSIWDRRYPVNCSDGYAGLKDLDEIIAEARGLLTIRGMND